MRKFLTISALIVLADQAIKLAVKGFSVFGITHQGMDVYQTIPIIGDTVRLMYVENKGMAFGWELGTPIILSVFSLVASAFLIYLLKVTERTASTGLKYSLALILGGAMGNLIDRMFYGIFYNYAPLCHGRVVDYMDIDIPDIDILGLHLNRFYVFNLADAAVSVGVILLLLFYPSKKKIEQHTAEYAPSAHAEAQSLSTGSSEAPGQQTTPNATPSLGT